MDGTLCRGGRPVPGAQEVLTTLRAEGRRLLLMSNNPLRTPEQHREMLSDMGLDVAPDEVLTSISALLAHLARQPIDGAVFAIAEPPLLEALEAAGHRLSGNPMDVACVIAAFDRTFDYRKWAIAHEAIRRGAMFIATNPDATYPTERGEIPDCAGIIAALEASTSTPVHAVLGKPSPSFLTAALEQIGTDPEDTLVVGDRLQTDVVMAAQGGLGSALVLTGVTTHAELAAGAIRPTFVLDSVADLLAEEAPLGSHRGQSPTGDFEVIAHRGARDRAPENTLRAFDEAEQLGVDAVEFDVRLTHDGVPVVIHDDTVDRTTDGSGAVRQLTCAQIQTLDAGRWFGAEFAGERVPTLHEVLGWATGNELSLHVELKSQPVPEPQLAAAAVTLIREFDLEERVVLSSFDHETLAEARRISPNLETAILSEARLHRPCAYARTLGATGMHCRWESVTPSLVGQARRAGLQLRAFAADDEAALRAVLALNCDGVITGAPAVALKFRDTEVRR